MFVLHIDLAVKPGREEALREAFLRDFRPAISAQGGFQSAELLQPIEEGTDRRLVLAFTDQPSQQRWVATDLHQAVWPVIAEKCATFTVKKFTDR